MNSGILQYHNVVSGWGGVCKRYLTDSNFASVACKQLGYSGVKEVSSLA